MGMRDSCCQNDAVVVTLRSSPELGGCACREARVEGHDDVKGPNSRLPAFDCLDPMHGGKVCGGIVDGFGLTGQTLSGRLSRERCLLVAHHMRATEWTLSYCKWCDRTVRVTTHLCFPISRDRSKPSRSNVESAPLNRKAGAALRPSVASG
jgi:hypothetical protein